MERGCTRANLVAHPCVLAFICGAVQEEVGNCLACLLAVGAESGVDFRDAVEVVVKGCMLHAELDQQAGLSTGEGSNEGKELL